MAGMVRRGMREAGVTSDQALIHALESRIVDALTEKRAQHHQDHSVTYLSCAGCTDERDIPWPCDEYRWCDALLAELEGKNAQT